MKLVVTGSSTGIGHALAARLLAHGHDVWGLARTAQSAPAGGGRFASSIADVANWAEVQRAAQDVQHAWPSLDGLVCCAAVQGEVGRTVAADPDRWAATVGINLVGTFNTIRAFHPLLRPEAPRRAKIVCFSGGGATKPRAHFSAYGASKTGVVRLVETIAEEERDAPLDINAIAPGAINTRLTDEVIAKGPALAGPAEYAAALKQKETGGHSLDRALDLIEWLLSPASDRITGRLISAPWDPWDNLATLRPRLESPKDDLYTLRRVT